MRLDPFGELRIELTALPAPARSPLVVAIDTHPVRSDGIFMRHKTSNRDIYRAARTRFSGVDDVIRDCPELGLFQWTYTRNKSGRHRKRDVGTSLFRRE